MNNSSGFFFRRKLRPFVLFLLKEIRFFCGFLTMEILTIFLDSIFQYYKKCSTPKISYLNLDLFPIGPLRNCVCVCVCVHPELIEKIPFPIVHSGEYSRRKNVFSISLRNGLGLLAVSA